MPLQFHVKAGEASVRRPIPYLPDRSSFVMVALSSQKPGGKKIIRICLNRNGIKLVKTEKGMQVADGAEGEQDGAVGLDNLSFTMVSEATVSTSPGDISLIGVKFSARAQAVSDGVRLTISIGKSFERGISPGKYTFDICQEGAGSVLDIEEENLGVFVELLWIFFKPVLSGLVQEVCLSEDENSDLVAMVAQQSRAALVTRYKGGNQKLC